MSDTANPGTPAPPTPRPLAAWRLWCAFLEVFRKQPTGLEGPDACQAIYARLLRFSDDHSTDPADIKRVTSALYRAVPLLQAALGWEEPSVGGKADKRSTTDRRRGEQWRLVLTFSGFETLGKALLGQKGRGGIKPEAIGKLLGLVQLPDYEPLLTPPHSETLRDDWFAADAQEELLDFLGLDFGDARITAAWLVERRPMATWTEGICLAKALRNATVHGALSASKVVEWKLTQPIQKLGEDIAAFAGAMLVRLTETAP